MTPVHKTKAAVGLCNASASKFTGRLHRPLTICNRAADSAGKSSGFSLAADDWYQLVPLGDFPGTLRKAGGKEEEAIQVIDAAALRAMLAAWPADQELLIDYEHFSHDEDKATIAAGWLLGLELRSDGIYGRIRWSEKGRSDVTGGNYRYISPEFSDFEDLGGGRQRPRVITGAGLTNRPGLKTLAPLCNRAATTTKNTKQTMDYKALLIQMLGLAPEATDEAITQAVAAKATTANTDKPDGDEPETVEELKEEVATLEKENEELKAELIEKDLDAHAAVITNRDLAKAMLIANRKTGIAFLKSIKPAAEAPARVYNRSTASTPAPATTEGKAAAAEKYAATVRNRANALMAADPKLAIGQAYNRARAEVDESAQA